MDKNLLQRKTDFILRMQQCLDDPSALFGVTWFHDTPTQIASRFPALLQSP